MFDFGDNIFQMKVKTLQECKNVSGGIVFGYHVHDPQRYGVVEFDPNNKVLSLEEKPNNPKSNYAVPGLYYYDNSVIEIAKKVKPSDRGEYEITDVNKEYLLKGKLEVKLLPRGTTWLDTGTFASLMQANQYVQLIEERQGRKIGCIEEAAFRMGYINSAKLQEIAEPLLKSGYGKYLVNLVAKNEKYLEELGKIIEKEINNLPYPNTPALLYDPIQYIMGMKGKRIRPLLVLIAYQLFDNKVEKALSSAIAIEMFHNFTLLHDDIMDNAPIRRGN